ncbi:MAG: invasion associated locus B family protein [Rhizobiaceae bacterium]
MGSPAKFLTNLIVASVIGAGSAFAQSSTATPKPNPAAGKPADPAKAPPQPWVVNCAAAAGKTELNCSMVQTVFARGSRLRLMSIAISKLATATGPKLQLSLPHGVSLQDNVEAWVDKGARQQVRIRNADANGSYAITDINDELLESLKKGSVFNAAFKTLEGKRVIVQISLNGFTNAFAKL